MLIVLAVLLILVLAALGLALFVPVRLTVEGGYDGRLHGSLQAAWPGGIVRVLHRFRENETLLFLGPWEAARGTGRERPKGRKKRVPAGKKTKKKPSFPALLSNLPELARVARRILVSLQPRGRVRGRFGTEDPALTGALYGLLCAALAGVPAPFRVLPDFTGSCLVLDASFSVRILVASLIAIAAGEALSRRGRRLLRSLRGS